MDETKWTPGPWEVDKYGNHMEVQQVDPDGISIAVMTVGSEADARLIAAAPAMAEAIRATLDQLDYLRGLWGDEGVTRTLCDRLRAALPADGA